MMETLPAQSQASAPLRLEDLVEQVVSQPSLFDGEDAPIDYQTVTEAKAISEGAVFVYTGSTVSMNEQKAMAIAIMRLSGVPKREIARRCQCSRHVIDLVLEQLEQAGKIAPLRERLPRLLGQVAEDAAEAAREIIHAGVIDAPTAAYLKALGVLSGIGADKHAGAQAVAGDLHLHQHVHLGDADPLRDYLRQRSEAMATESNAGGAGANSLQRNGTSDLAAGVAAGSGAVVEVEACPAATDSAGSETDQAADPDRGAGGVRDARGASVL
jgi:hypothetical protein